MHFVASVSHCYLARGISVSDDASASEPTGELSTASYRDKDGDGEWPL